MKRHLLTSAAATLMVVAYTSQSPCVWGFSALRAVTRSPQSLHRHSSDDIDETMPAITRAGALTATFGGVLIVAARSSFAAIPTTEDYAIGSGTKVNIVLSRSCYVEGGTRQVLPATVLQSPYEY